MRVLGIDLGSKRIGLAISDETGSIAFPAGVIERKGEARDLDALRSVVRERGAEHVVVGLPLHLDGREGETARAARAFGERLGRELGLPVSTVDERFTTALAERGRSSISAISPSTSPRSISARRTRPSPAPLRISMRPPVRTNSPSPTAPSSITVSPAANRRGRQSLASFFRSRAPRREKRGTWASTSSTDGVSAAAGLNEFSFYALATTHPLGREPFPESL